MTSSFPLLISLWLAILQTHGLLAAKDLKNPNHGFTSIPLNNSNFEIQKPYNVPLASRYSYKDGVHKLWVLSTDKPHNKTSPTHSRTEIRIHGLDYNSGVWQFYVPTGTTGTTIMQIHGDERVHTFLMLRVYDGAFMNYRYGDQILADDIYGKWIQLNVIHDVDRRKIDVYMDRELKFTVMGQKNSSYYYFKAGVYGTNDSSFFTESLWKGIKVFKLEK